jgi:hypothetical protein
MRLYAVLDMYLSFEVHTSETIAAGRAAGHKFDEAMSVSAVHVLQFSIS